MDSVQHRPFGTAMVDGGVRFRLWAPAAGRVDLRLTAPAPQTIAMTAVGHGWYEVTTDTAGPGSRYQFVIDGGIAVPDPASRFQPDDVHAASAVVAPDAFVWVHNDWPGRPWHETVLYELHVGTFSPEGTFAGVERRLGHLADLGVTAIELMPINDFSGRRNWGYDGVLPYAPDSAYGTPDDLKHLVDAAHSHGLMMFLDVVYNHFGPDGNYLHLYAPPFFTNRHATPWGAAIDFSCREVRDFFIHNALYWLEEFRFDGLRLDAVHAIADDSMPDFLTELADRVNRRFAGRRQVHLVLENDDNAAHYLSRQIGGAPRHYVAQWNDDIHHTLHVLATGERSGYYADYADDPIGHLGRCFGEGFAYQGESSRYRDGRRRGEPAAHLPPSAFVAFLQNHDQVGNRALGERISVLTSEPVRKALLATLLLAPNPPMLFMGEEWGTTQPFPFFCDFRDELADSVREGRCREFARFAAVRNEAARARIPDPNAPGTFDRAVLDWSALGRDPHARWLAFYQTLLALRQREIVPRLARLAAKERRWDRCAGRGLVVAWPFVDGSELKLLANFGDTEILGCPPPPGRLLFATSDEAVAAAHRSILPRWSAIWSLTGEPPDGP